MSKYLKAAPETIEEIEMEIARAIPLSKTPPRRRTPLPVFGQNWLGMAAAADLFVFVRTVAVEQAYDTVATGFRLLVHTLTVIASR